MEKHFNRKRLFFLLVTLTVIVVAFVVFMTSRQKISFQAAEGDAIFSISGSSNWQVGSEHDITVNMDTGSNSVIAVDVVITYPADLLQLVSDNQTGIWNVYGDPQAPNDTPGIMDRMAGSSTGLSGTSVPIFTAKFKSLAVGQGSFTITKGDAAITGPVSLTTILNGAPFTNFVKPIQPTVTIPPMTYKSTYTLTGTMDSGVTQVLINGTPVAVNLTNHTWSSDINLSIGDNPITIQGGDSTGNLSDSVPVNLIRYKMADANNDSNVEILDFAILMTFWNKDFITFPNAYLADFNEDDSVEILDFSLLMQNWRK